MKLIRRRKSPNPAQKGFKVVKLALRGLVVQRIARNAFRAYKLVRRLPVILGGAAVAAFALKKLRGGDQGGPETWTQPPATPAPPPIQTSGTSAERPAEKPTDSPVETAAVGTPPVEGPEAGGGPEVPESEGDGAPDPDIEMAAAATDAGTTDGGSEAVADDAATAIGDDLAAAAERSGAEETDEKS